MCYKIGRGPQVILKKRIPLDQVQIINNSISNRKINPQFETKINDIWSKKLQESQEKGYKLWDSTNYRLNEFCIENKELYIELSTIKFCERLALKEQAEEIIELGSDYFPKGLFVSTIIKTTDDKYVFANLSKNTLSGQSHEVSVVGGVLSKDEQEIKTSRDLIDAITREFSEELNISSKSIKNIEFLGLISTASLNCSIVCSVDLNISSEEIQSQFIQKNDEELDSLIFIKKRDLKKFLKENTGGYMPKIVELV